MDGWIGEPHTDNPPPLKWIYFTGKTGNERGYQRRGCQFFEGKVWKKCRSDGSGSYGKFLPDHKYRKPNDETDASHFQGEGI